MQPSEATYSSEYAHAQLSQGVPKIADDPVEKVEEEYTSEEGSDLERGSSQNSQDRPQNIE
jgi:hypothetical protein